MKKKFWSIIGILCGLFLLLGVVQGVRHPEILSEAVQIIGGYEMDFSEESE